MPMGRCSPSFGPAMSRAPEGHRLPAPPLRRLHTFCLLAAGALVAGRLAAQSCPGVAPLAGYPVAVAGRDAPLPDTGFLRDFARAAAYRWAVPSRRRNAYSGWQRVSRRLLPPEPRWADDWRPSEPHRAQLLLMVYRKGPPRRLDLSLQSGDRLFDQSLRSIVEEPLPGSPPFPLLPDGLGSDSLTVSVSLGFVDTTHGPVGLVRFAAEQQPVRLVPGSLRVEATSRSNSMTPGPRRATVAYDVTISGSVDPGSIEVLESTDPDLSEAIRDALLRARFTPAESNCRPVAQSVIQTFGP